MDGIRGKTLVPNGYSYLTVLVPNGAVNSTPARGGACSAVPAFCIGAIQQMLIARQGWAGQNVENVFLYARRSPKTYANKNKSECVKFDTVPNLTVRFRTIKIVLICACKLAIVGIVDF